MLKKRIVSLLLSLMMVLTLLPSTMFVAGEQGEENGEYVYISISYDGQFVDDQNGTPVVYQAVAMESLEAIDLDTYGLSDYYYDGDGDGVYDITALHLYIYTHEVIMGLDWLDVRASGDPGSIYFEAGLFGFSDSNLNYYYNGAYPELSPGWGATADNLVLKNGDFCDIAGYSSWSFWMDSYAGFHYFTDGNGNITHSYEVEAGQEIALHLSRSGGGFGGVLTLADVSDYTVYYGKTLGQHTGTVTTDENGYAEIPALEEGTWYLWCDGGYGEWGDIVSSPAYAEVVVTTPEPIISPDEEAANAVEEKIAAIGTVTLNSKEAIEKSRTAYDALTDAQKALVENYDVLVAAEKALAAIDADMEAANAVVEKINAIGTVSIHSAKKIADARSAYNALTEAQKAYVENYKTLTDAEAAIVLLYAEAADADHKAIYEVTGKYISALGVPTVGSVGGEWMIIDLVRDGYDCPEGYYENVVKYVQENINEKEQLHRSKGTDNSRVILALTAAGYDVTDVAGHNLLMGLTDMTYVKKQGINGPIWALIAFDTHDYEIPVNKDAAEQVTREGLIAYILEKQLEDGGWALSGQKADSDVTGMAIQSLAPYYEKDAKVKEAVDKALAALSEIQLPNGGYGSMDGACSESCAQVIVALTALGINPETDARFIKNGVSVVDAMCLFAVDGGGFAHVPNGALNGMATEQAQYALVSYFRFLDGKTALYDMTDVTIRVNEKEETPEVKPGDKTENETKPEDNVTAPVTGDNSIAWFYIVLAACGMVLVLNNKKFFIEK